MSTDHLLSVSLLKKLKNDALVLPTLPAVAMRSQEVVGRTDTSLVDFIRAAAYYSGGIAGRHSVRSAFGCVCFAGINCIGSRSSDEFIDKFQSIRESCP